MDAATRLYASTPRLHDIAGQLASHALRSPGAVGRNVLAALVDAIRTRGSAEHRDALERALIEFGPVSEHGCWLACEVALLRDLSDDPMPQRAAACRRAVDGSMGVTEARTMAMIASKAHGRLVVDDLDPAWFAMRARELDPDGWGAYLDVELGYDAKQGRDPARLVELIQTGADRNDVGLSVRNLLWIAWAGDHAADIAHVEPWIARSVVESRRTRDFRLQFDALWDMVAVLVLELRLDEARDHLARMVQLVEHERLVALRSELVSRAALFAAESGRADDLTGCMQRVGWAKDADPIDRWIDVDPPNVQVAVLRAVTLGVLDHPRAREALAAARNLPVDQWSPGPLLMAIAACNVAPDAGAWRQFPELLVGASTSPTAEAIGWLSNHVAIDEPDGALDVLRAVLEVELDARYVPPVLDLARRQGRAVLDGDWRALVDVADTWRRCGFERDAALARASAAAIAAQRGMGLDAQRLFDAAHHALARLGFVGDIARLRRARTRHGSPGALKHHSTSLLDTLELDATTGGTAANYVVRRVVTKGSTFPAEFVCSVVSGLASLDHDDAASPVDIAVPGDVVHAERALGATSRPIRARAITACVVDVVPMDSIEIEAARSAPVALALGRWVAERVERDRDRALRIARLPVERRLAIVILDLAERLGKETRDGGRAVDLPRTLLAPLIGASREATSRTLSTMAHRGDVDTSSKGLIVPDLDRLRQLALPDQ